MNRLKGLAGRFWTDERGLELSEYAVMAGVIILVAIGVILLLGDKITAIFQTLLGRLDKIPTST